MSDLDRRRALRRCFFLFGFGRYRTTSVLLLPIDAKNNHVHHIGKGQSHVPGNTPFQFFLIEPVCVEVGPSLGPRVDRLVIQSGHEISDEFNVLDRHEGQETDNACTESVDATTDPNEKHDNHDTGLEHQRPPITTEEIVAFFVGTAVVVYHRRVHERNDPSRKGDAGQKGPACPLEETGEGEVHRAAEKYKPVQRKDWFS